MNGRRWIGTVAVLQACFAVGCVGTESFERPNIIFFFVDDQRNDTLGAAGHPIVKTPNVDRLAEQGVRFQNAFVTTSICSVSRATVLTGMWSRSHGTPERVDAVNLEAASTIYPALLHAAGYRTGFFGKWGAEMPEGFDRKAPFDVYHEISRTPYFKKLLDGSRRHETELIGDGAVRFIDSQPEGQPFMLNLWFNAAHAEDRDKRPGVGHFPWPKAVDGMYDDVEIPAPRLNDPQIYQAHPKFLQKSLNRRRYFWRWDTPEKYTANMRAYYRMLSGIDRVVGRVLRMLENKSLAKNTIVVYSADNGYYMGDRGFAGKWSHYDESIRVPLIIYDPRLPAANRGQTLSQMALNVDLPSTFLDLAGVALPERYQGQSLMPLVRGEAVPGWRKDFFAEHLVEFQSQIPKWEGVRATRWMYARYFEQTPIYEYLHDLEADPDQLENLAEDPAHAEVLASMRKRCDTLRDSLRDISGDTSRDTSRDTYGGPYQRIDRP